MKTHLAFASIFLATTLLSGMAYATEQSDKGATSQSKEAQKTAEADFGKLSKEGAAAFRDLHLARVAIFDAQPDMAKSLISKAQEALGKAKTDETAFMKAESDLKTHAAANDQANGDTTKMQSPKANSDPASGSAQPVAWIPVDGQLLLGEGFVATPQKAAAVADANSSLKKGDKKGAVEKLKLASIDVVLTVAVLPLVKTTDDVQSGREDDRARKVLRGERRSEAG